jgi:hypothetical protein
MARDRTLLGAAVGLNTVMLIGEAVAGGQAQRVRLLRNRLQHLADEMAWLFLTWLPPRALSRTCLCSPHGLHAHGLQVMRAVLV